MTPTILQQKRHQQILTDVVRHYIETGEPVSSRSISRRHLEPLSSATVRNVMADLEEGGFLFQPHTSAGRVPTAAAYRFFVEQVAAQATASPEDRQWIRRELDSAQTPEAVMERASHVLSAVSRGLGIFISPPLARSVVEHVRFLLLPDNRVLVVLITSGGQTRDKLVRPERSFQQVDLDRTAEYLNRHYVGWTLEKMRADLRAQVDRDREQYEDEQRKRVTTTDMLRGQSGIQIRVKASRELMHLKAYVIDGSLLRDGSANWSPSGLRRQDNNAHFTSDRAQVAAFQQLFEQMWKRSDNERISK